LKQIPRFGDFDIVFCSNLLYYYQEGFRSRMLSRLSRSLADPGFFVTDDTTRPLLERRRDFEPLEPSVAVFTQRCPVDSAARKGRSG